MALLFFLELTRNGFLYGLLAQIFPDDRLAWVGLLGFAHTLTDALAKVPMAMWVQRFGLGSVGVLASASGLLCLFFGMHTPLFLLMVWVVLWGLGMAALWPSVLTLISERAVSGKETQALNIGMLILNPAGVVGFFGLGSLVQYNLGLVQVLLAVGLITALLSGVALWKVTPHSHSSGDSVRQSVRTSWLEVGPLIPAAFAQTLVPGLITIIFYRFLQVNHLTLLDLLWLGLPMGACLALCLNLALRVSNPLHRVILGLLGQMVGMVLTVTVPLGLPLYLVCVGCAFGIGIGFFIAGWNGLIVQQLPPERRSVLWGFLMSIEAAGTATGLALGAWSWNWAGWRSPFVLAALCLAAVQIYYLFYRKTSATLSTDPK